MYVLFLLKATIRDKKGQHIQHRFGAQAITTEPFESHKMSYYGGVEGGGTHSKLIVCNETGEEVVAVNGPATNHWMIGIPECANRIARMVADAKQKANLSDHVRLRSLGLSLSGCEDEITNKRLEDEIASKQLADHYVICSDTLGSIATATAAGGMVLIAGTGSNSFLRNADGETFNCGGWGHMLGDEGGAWWISHRMIKVVFDDMDNLAKAPADTSVGWSLIQKHFGVQTRSDLLQHCYGCFDKSKFAKLCEMLASAANDGDELCRWVFVEAGRNLGRMAQALLQRAGAKMINQPWVDVVCVGSVWKSWNLLQSGFTDVESSVELRLVRLKQTMALGAMYLACDKVSAGIKRDYEQNVTEFYRVNTKTLPKHPTNGHNTSNGLK